MVQHLACPKRTSWSPPPPPSPDMAIWTRSVATYGACCRSPPVSPFIIDSSFFSREVYRVAANLRGGSSSTFLGGLWCFRLPPPTGAARRYYHFLLFLLSFLLLGRRAVCCCGGGSTVERLTTVDADIDMRRAVPQPAGTRHSFIHSFSARKYRAAATA
jgi:hypothetical protein